MRRLEEMPAKCQGGSISLSTGEEPFNFWHMCVEVILANDKDTCVGLGGKQEFEWVHLLAGPKLLLWSSQKDSDRGRDVIKRLRKVVSV